jgi:DNA-directed RNA polymerase III subunit RPC7
MHDGPLYTVLDPKARIQKPGELTGAWKPPHQISKGRATADPFTAMSTYSHKFQKNKRTMPELDKRDYGMSAD